MKTLGENMNKILLIISMLALLFLSACAPEQDAVACTMDARACPDGSYVGRTGPDCEFQTCPACDYESGPAKYVGKSEDECSRIKFICEEDTEYFANGCGCGCQPIIQEANEDENGYYMSIPREDCSLALIQCPFGMEGFVDDIGCGCRNPAAPEGKIKVTDCTEEQKQTQACTKEYLPVCGWSDPAKVQCIKYPCAQTFGNICSACADENVISWSEGECPEG